MPRNDDEIVLQPIAPELLEREKTRGKERIKRATALVEFEEICADAEKGDELSLSTIGNRFGIRHLILATALTAVVVTLFKQFGPLGAVLGTPFALIIGGWLIVRERERSHAADISDRLREFEQKHRSVSFSSLDVDRSWKNAAREEGSAGNFSTQQCMLGGTVLAVFCALWSGSSPVVAGFVLCLVTAVVLVLRKLDAKT